MANDEWMVTLKDGNEIDARVAMGNLNVLRGMDKRQGDLRLLYQHAIGHLLELPTHLKEAFCTNGVLLPSMKAVLVNGIRKTNDGISVVDPFTENPNNKHVLQTVKDARKINYKRLIVDQRGDKGSPGPRI